MEILSAILMMFGLVFLIFAVVISDNKAVFPLILVGIIFILISNDITGKARLGRPAPSLNVLTEGEKYEIVGIYEKYIIIKSATDNGELKFIGPLDFGTRAVTIGRYIKTAEENLEKIE